jgi:multiple sugar transport system ATP-binding protein
MTVYGNLAFGLRVAKPRPGKAEIDREVRKVARVVGVADILEQRAGRLSVNDMQKVALGRSMIVDPSIFLLDEPFSNLDAAFRSYMRAELKRIQHEIGQTMIYVTHDQVEAMGMADRVAVMNAGVLQQVGTPPEIYSKPANTFVARFAGSTLINFLPASAVPGYQRNGRPITIAVRPEHVRIVPDDSPDAVLVASVKVIEPLGAKDVVHLSFGDHELRAIGSPGQRPSVGERVGLAFVEQSVLRFNAETGAAVD